MKLSRPSLLWLFLACFLVMGSSCSLWNKAFGPKYGCPANGRSTGAEKILSGEKVPKAKKFKA